MSGAAVTPSGVREGDPAALAALCTVRGPSVLAYCRQVAGESEAGAAAADAFARFRKAVVEAGDATSFNPEALLISATRMAAAQRADVVAPGHCAAVPRLLAERADKTLPEADLARLEAHLAECWACRAPVARFKAAERAYLDPPEPKLDPAVAEQILAALVAAVPPPPQAEPEPPVLQAPNGAVPHAAPEPEPASDPDATQAFVTVGEPRPAAPEMAEYDPADVAGEEIGSEPAPRPKRARRATPALLGGLSRRAKRRERAAQPEPEPEPEAQAAAAAAATAFAATPVSEAAVHEAPAQEAVVEPAAEPAAEPVAEPAAATPPDPISYESADYAPRPRDRRGARSRRLPVLLPIILIVLALLVALFVSGVFGGSEPESSPRVSVPAAAPATSKADLVVVPGAKEATGDQVELAKARDRARQRGETPASDTSDGAAKQKTTATATATPPPPPAATAGATPAANAAPPPPPPPPPAATKKPSGQKQIDAFSGATGAEQIPPPADTSDVPDLAPPPETATSP